MNYRDNFGFVQYSFEDIYIVEYTYFQHSITISYILGF